MKLYTNVCKLQANYTKILCSFYILILLKRRKQKSRYILGVINYANSERATRQGNTDRDKLAFAAQTHPRQMTTTKHGAKESKKIN
jgi:hypothetical protein